jgi:acyl-CoA synthetase (AMP-forming)/AMP-acid ligase II
MSWTSGYEAVEAGGTTLHRLVLERADQAGDRSALIDGPSGQMVSYGTLASRVERVAAGLAERGFEAGDVLALWAPNVVQWAGVALGAMAAGGAVTGINPDYTERELKGQLADSGASLLVTVPPLAPTALSASSGARVREIVMLGGPGEEIGGTTSVYELIGGDGPFPESAADPDAVALLPYSSGTTGLPKGVMLTHSNLVTSVRQVLSGLRVTERDTMLAVAPFFHVMGFVVDLAVPLAAGAKVVTMSRFEVGEFFDLIERHRVTVLVVPPPVMALLARHPLADAHDLSSLEMIVSGGAPLSAGLQRAVADRFPKASVGQGWGLTETAVGATMPERGFGTVPGSVGRVMPSTELRVVDPDTGRDLGTGERGELLVRGPQVMKGYLNRPDATLEILDSDGWLGTGDLGCVDGDGNVFVVDRLKNLIKVSAYQVAPAELEALLVAHPRVADAAVVGRPDERLGEVPVAAVVSRGMAGEVDAEGIMAWVAERVAPHKRLRAVRFVDEIPRTPSGKLLRRLLTERGRQDPLRAGDQGRRRAREPQNRV